MNPTHIGPHDYERHRRNRTLPRAMLAALVMCVFAQIAPAANPAVNGFDYFPLMVGSTYVYQYTQVQAANPVVSSTVTVKGDVSFGGRSSLTLLEWTHVCGVGPPCDSLSRFYYSTDPAAGVLWHGVYNVAGSGLEVTATYTTPQQLFKPSVVPGTLTSVGTGITYVGADQWGGPRVGNSTLTGTLVGTYYYEARQLISSMSVPAGTYANVLYVYSFVGGYERHSWYAPGVGLIRWKDQVQEAQLASVVPPPAAVTVVEYYHASLDHYFITALQSEIDKLDGGAFQGWVRTGYTFKAVDAPASKPPGASVVCRFYGNPAVGLDSHFYSASPAECDAVREQWPGQWLLESSNVFQIYLPNAVLGVCPANTRPVYRSWNGRIDSNHRYAVEPSVQAQMIAKGWVAEGYGTPAVAMCAPL